MSFFMYKVKVSKVSIVPDEVPYKCGKNVTIKHITVTSYSSQCHVIIQCRLRLFNI